MAAPRVFLSYAGGDSWWVDLFRKYFNIGNVVFEAANVAFGELESALEEQLEGSVAVVAFVSEKYKSTESTVADWEKSLSEQHRRRLIFVPIMLDAHAIEWWKELRRAGRLGLLSRDYRYADFTDGGGYALPGPDKPQYIEKIVKLADEVKDDIFKTPDPETKTPVVPPEPQTVVFLGHPSASLPADLQSEVQQVADALGANAVKWSDSWRKNPGTDLAAGAVPLFVQPITDAEAADYVENPNKISTYLAALGRPDARVAIWLPKKYRDDDFERAAQACASESKYPTLRTDSPQDLANWLRQETQLPDMPEAMVVQVQGYGDTDGVPVDAKTKTTVDQLCTEMWNIVSGIVKKPRPASPAWQFWDTQFGRQIRILPGSRAVVAIHDLDINPSLAPRLRRQGVENKFKVIYEAVKVAQQERQDAGKPPLKVFWTALLVNNGELLPFSNYPDDGLYKDWRLLEFSQPDDDQGGPAPVPDPASLAVFRTNLHAWAITP